LAGSAAEGVISADLYVNTMDNPTNKTFVEAFEKEFGNKPEKIELLGFETVWLIAKAMDKAGTSSDYDKIAETLRANEWETPRGIVKFDEHGQALADVSPLVIKDGQVAAYMP
jgi:branched-chain amino acid transport system substrate-binding protein